MHAFAYVRTSSATNAGYDKDSDKRQLAAINAYAKANNVKIVGTFTDIHTGTDSIFDRPGFADMLGQINLVSAIIVETANRFARDLIIAETGFEYLKGKGITLIAADSPTAFLDDTPTNRLIRQILGAVSQFEKSTVVEKLRVARDRKRLLNGQCEGRKSTVTPYVAQRAKELISAGYSQRETANRLAIEGHLSPSGKVWHLKSIQDMLRPKRIQVQE